MDAFYAAVEERRRPELRGRPIVVGADPRGGTGRGVVTAASYPARKLGIRSALPISRAWRLAEAARARGEPETVFLLNDPALYREVSGRLMALLAQGADAFEAASVDEAYLDLSSLGDLARAEAHARTLKAEVRDREGLTASIGIGPNKLVAKIASDLRKPDALIVVRPEEVQALLDPLGIRVIPGIGPKTEAFLKGHGIATVADLRAVDPGRLEEWLGKWGADLARKAQGLSDDPVSGEWERKSVGEQETFDQDSLDPAFVLGRGRALASEVYRRLRADGFLAFRTVTVTVRFAGFVTRTRSRTLPAPGRDLDALEAEARRLLLPFLDERENPRRKKIRLIGVRVERLLREADLGAGASTGQGPASVAAPGPAGPDATAPRPG
jgi:DNA polymerase IV (DinB-like DNA polymerase)